jgi:hypothetical protein
MSKTYLEVVRIRLHKADMDMLRSLHKDTGATMTDLLREAVHCGVSELLRCNSILRESNMARDETILRESTLWPNPPGPPVR